VSEALEYRFGIARSAPSWAKVPDEVEEELWTRILADRGLELGDLSPALQEILLRCELEVSALGQADTLGFDLGRRDPRIEDAALDSDRGILALVDHPIPVAYGVPLIEGVPWTDEFGGVHPWDEPTTDDEGDIEPEDEDPDDDLEGEDDDVKGLPAADDAGWVGL
jgi:hypothetical protein